MVTIENPQYFSHFICIYIYMIFIIFLKIRGKEYNNKNNK